MQALVLTSSGSYHVDSEVAGCLKGWGGDLIVKSGSATSSVSDIGLAHVTGDSVSSHLHLWASLKADIEGASWSLLCQNILLTSSYPRLPLIQG